MVLRVQQRKQVQKTILLVGEGFHDEAFLKHVKQLYVSRGCGLAVTIKNAKGKGAHNVVQWTIRQSRVAAYDHVAVLLDTDTDWTPKVAADARRNKIQVLTADPCFEALLLRALGVNPRGGNASELKPILRAYLTHEPTEPQAYSARFNRAVLEASRIQEGTINSLLLLFGA